MNRIINPVHVAVGVVKTDADHVLISRRHDHLHQGGLWEFPGGKVDQGETVEQALSRELYEELGITVIDSEPLIQVTHDYGDKQVVLDVYLVTDYEGKPSGCEGQEVKVVASSSLNDYAFPAANRGIIAAIQLPRLYMITSQYEDESSLLASVERAIQAGVRLIQFRAHHLSENTYQSLARALLVKCKDNHVTLLLNTAIQNFQLSPTDGLHLTSARLMACQCRPIDKSFWLGASVHNLQELKQAIAIEADYILIAPVKNTVSHSDAVPLGWDQFQSLARQANMPVYALGGMKREDMDEAKSAGAHGIAGISLFR